MLTFPKFKINQGHYETTLEVTMLLPVDSSPQELNLPEFVIAMLESHFDKGGSVEGPVTGRSEEGHAHRAETYVSMQDLKAMYMVRSAINLDGTANGRMTAMYLTPTHGTPADFLMAKQKDYDLFAFSDSARSAELDVITESGAAGTLMFSYDPRTRLLQKLFVPTRSTLVTKSGYQKVAGEPHPLREPFRHPIVLFVHLLLVPIEFT